jgi:hypothetical protein
VISIPVLHPSITVLISTEGAGLNVGVIVSVEGAFVEVRSMDAVIVSIDKVGNGDEETGVEVIGGGRMIGVGVKIDGVADENGVGGEYGNG